ncbi:VCBS domain-containing protein, partial [Ferrimonas marina]
DGSETQVTITVTGTNDAPSISADSGSVTEDIDVNNGMLATGGDLNLVLGADDSNTTLSFEADGDDYLGTFVVNDDGSWSFSVDNSLDAIQQLGPDDSLVQTYTVTVDDGQGGVLSQTVTVTIQGTGELEGGDLAGITLDDAATEGNQTDTQTTTLTFTLGVFAIAAYAFGDTDGIQIDGLDGSLSWQVVSGSLVGYLDGDLQQPMISLSLQDLGDGNVSVQATLMENLQHQVDLDQLTISGIEVVATDAGGNSASGQVNLTVLDDGISLVAGDLQGENAANYHGEGTLELEGVDQGYSADFNPTIAKLMGDSYQGEAFTDSGLTSNGYSVFYYVDPANPDVLIAYLDTNDVPSAYQGEDGANGQQLIFTLTADPDNGSYSIDGHVSIDSLETIEIAGVEGATGGNGPILYIGYDSTTGAFDVEYNAADIAPNFELAFTLTARSNDGSEGKVNGNNNGVGIDNAFIQDDEVLIVDYQQDVAATSVSFAGADEIAYRAFDADGNLLDEGTIRSGEVIENVGSISYIELMSAGSGSEFRFQFSGTSAETIVSTTKDVTLDFTLGVTDSDGDTVEDDFTIELAAPGPDNQGDDIILGDAGGSELQEQPLDYNYVIMIDTSESLYTWELQEVKAAVTNMLNSMKDHPGTVTVKLIGFAKNVDGQSQDTFDVTDPDQLASAQAFVEALFSRGVTNYEAAFQEAIDWLQGDAPAADETHTFLITDGIPTANLRGDDANGTQSGNSERAIKHLLGQANNDSQDEVALLNSLSNSLRAVGFGMDPDQLLTDAVDLTGDGQPDNVTTQLLMDHIDSSGAAQLLEGSNGLDQTLQNLVELTLDGVGRQLLDGGAGNDILFGDSPNTDELAQQQGLDLPPGSGTKVFEALEQDPANNWSREDTLNYVRTHHQTLSQESVDSGGQGRDGGDDILYGGAGDDILYGQEGDDLLVGGLGSDLLSGGSGADTFAWRDGDADGSLDTVVDFSRADGDRLDLSDLLVGEEQGDLTDYLNVSTDGTDTTIEVTPTGVGAPSLTIVLEGNQYQDLDALLQDGALVLDSAQPSANNAAGGPAIDVAPQQNELLP